MAPSRSSPAGTGRDSHPDLARFEMIRTWAEERLAQTFSTKIDARVREVIADFRGVRNKVLRLSVSPHHPAAIPATVVAKFSNPRSRHLEIEAINLGFLGDLPATREIVPALYAYDATAGALLIEDLWSANSRRISEILDGDNPGLAANALEALQRSAARMHGVTAGLLGDYRRRLAHLENMACAPTHPVERLDAALLDFVGLPGRWGFDVCGFEEECRAVARIIDYPGPFLVFTHGDATVLNAFYSPRGARLIDFEIGRYRHALIEGAFGSIRYVCSSRARRVPGGLRQKMTAAYREELSRTCAAARDNDRFNRELTAAAAAWLAVFCSWLPRAMVQDYVWGHASARQRICCGLDHFIELAGETGHFPAISTTAARLKRRLENLWYPHERELNSFPAFTALQ
jgi:hypothetical protein